MMIHVLGFAAATTAVAGGSSSPAIAIICVITGGTINASRHGEVCKIWGVTKQKQDCTCCLGVKPLVESGELLVEANAVRPGLPPPPSK